MTEYSKGGVVHGTMNLKVYLVPYPQWYIGNQLPGNAVWVVYADECFISRDMKCVRKDGYHKRFARHGFED